MSDIWPTETIGDLFEIGAGKSVTPVARHGEPKHPFLRTSNVFWGRMDLSEVDSMHFTKDEIASKSLRKGDLLVCEGGDIGRAAIWDGELTNCCFQNNIHRLRSKHDNTVSRFYLYYLQAGFTQLGIYEGAGNKTTIPNLSRNRLSALLVPRPGEIEQKKIAALLWKIQRAIEVEEKLTVTARELKQAAMRQLFTHGLRGEAQQETEIGLIPDSWNPLTILELCEIWSGGTPRKSIAEYWSGNVPWVSGKDLKSPSLDDAIDHISVAGVDSACRLAPQGAVLLLVRGMGLAKDLPVAVINRPMTFNQDVKALVTRGEYSGRFIRSAIYAGKERLLSRIVPSAHGTMTLNLDDVENFKVACPSDPNEATEIVAVFDALDRKISLHESKRLTLKELFKTLLYKLMTGEIRVADLKIDVGEVTQ
jgi:type I restriction enzyme, S subunit